MDIRHHPGPAGASYLRWIPTVTGCQTRGWPLLADQTRKILRSDPKTLVVLAFRVKELGGNGLGPERAGFYNRSVVKVTPPLE